jgi:hypothetical protein
MTLLKAVVLGLLVAMAASCGVCGTVVYEENFSAPFVQHDWVYNNSGSNSVVGYPGNIGGKTQPWPCQISNDGHELLGYSPVYHATNFQSFTLGQLSGQDGWVGSGTIGPPSHGRVPGSIAAKSVSFTNESAYRNVDLNMQHSVQYVQCYVRKSYTSIAVSYVYAGTQNLGSVAAAVRLNDTGQIEALNGNGSGPGEWVALADYVADQWYRITFKLNYGTSTYRAAVQGGFGPPGHRVCGHPGIRRIHILLCGRRLRRRLAVCSRSGSEWLLVRLLQQVVHGLRQTNERCV